MFNSKKQTFNHRIQWLSSAHPLQSSMASSRQSLRSDLWKKLRPGGVWVGVTHPGSQWRCPKSWQPQNAGRHCSAGKSSFGCHDQEIVSVKFPGNMSACCRVYQATGLINQSRICYAKKWWHNRSVWEPFGQRRRRDGFHFAEVSAAGSTGHDIVWGSYFGGAFLFADELHSMHGVKNIVWYNLT